MRQRTRIIFVDFHAEATSEKIAMGWHLDGRVTAVVGHAYARADRRRAGAAEGHGLPDGRRDDRAARFDHRRRESSRRSDAFLTGLPSRFETATANPRLNAVVVDADEATGKATDIERLSYSLDELDRARSR